MSISAISGAAGSYAANFQSAFTQRRSDFSALGLALKSGDLAGAKAAFAALQADMKNIAGQTAQPSASGTQKSDLFTQLAQALASGDLTGAQQAFAALQAQAGHGHHHRHCGGGTSAGSPANASGGNASSGTDGNALASTGTVLDTSA